MTRNICFIGGGLDGGGQERALSSLANKFSSMGHKVTIINLFKTETFFDIDKNISVIWPQTDRNRNNRIIYAIKIIPYLRRSIHSSNPDVLLSFGEWFNPFVILSTRLIKIPLFIFDRMGPGLKLGFLIDTAKKFLYRFASGIVVQTSTAAQMVKKNTGSRNVAIIPNPVNVINHDVQQKEKIILTVGRLSREKGHKILIEAFGNLEKTGWNLHIVGDGPEKSKLEKQAVDCGVAESVVFHGHLKDFRSIIGKSQIFVLPSYYEGFPNALLEAMSAPLACISSDCLAGPKDIIQEGKNGMLFKTGDVKELTKKMIILINDKNLRDALANEAIKVRDQYGFDKIAAKYLQFIFE